MMSTVRDEALVTSLWETHGAALLSYATRLCANRGAAEDAVHHALIRAWRTADRLPSAKLAQRTVLLSFVRDACPAPRLSFSFVRPRALTAR
jgi:RNA polymerase sigma-70 factor, ECF subfamily